jgi:hypothetical protein
MKQKRTKWILGLILGILFLSQYSYASHYVGGEITWKCKSNGKYVFYLRIYRECNGISFGTSQTIQSNSPAGSISLSLVTGYPKDLSPICNSDGSFTHLSCSSATTNNSGAVSVYYYKSSSDVVLNGIPPASGWIFSWSSCCRNPSVNTSGQPGWYLKSTMYPYGQTNAYPCFDNSPDYAEPPATIVNTGFNSISSYAAIDSDNDDLVYEWGQPMVGNNNPLPYSTNYSYTSPLPDTVQNPNNSAAILDSTTGMITFTSYTTGAYVCMVKTTSYKNGIKTAEVSRELNMVITNEGTNTSPDFGYATNFRNIIRDTIYAGDSIHKNIGTYDIQFLPNGIPQSNYINAYGNIFGSYIPPNGSTPATISNYGCIITPCATIYPAADDIHSIGGYFGIQTSFDWRSSNAHLKPNGIYNNGNNEAGIYNFYFHSKDDYCPVPAYQSLVLSIVVIKPPADDKVQINCVRSFSNGDVKLNFSSPQYPNNFVKLKLYSSFTKNGPYTLIDSINSVNTTSYTHAGARSDTSRRFYYTEYISQFTPTILNNVNSDTVSTIFLEAQDPNFCHLDLQWNPIYDSTSSLNNSKYYIYAKTSGIWNIIDSTINTHYSDSIHYTGNLKSYRIISSCPDVANNNNRSNIVSKYIPSFADQKLKIRTTDITLPSGDVNIYWNKYSDLNNSFNHYSLWYKTDTNTAFNPLTQITNIDSTHYLHIGASANQRPIKYYLQSEVVNCDNNPLTIASYDTISTIYIYSIQSNNNQNSIYWTKARSMSLNSISPYYLIHRRGNDNIWNLIDSTTQLSYTDLNSSAEVFSYRISQRDYNPFEQPTICYNSSNEMSEIYAGIESPFSNSIELSGIQPNPFNNRTQLLLYSKNSSKIEFTIYDIKGKVQRQWQYSAHKGLNNIQIYKYNLSAGSYILKYSNYSESKTVRLMIY